MTPRLAGIWRHPIKAHGREPLDEVHLQAGRTMPGDRVWAVAHDAAQVDGTAWAPCANFSRGAKLEGLMAIKAQHDPETGRLRLTHPDLPPLEFDPDSQGDRLIAWTRPLMKPGRAQSARVIRVPGRGMTDSDFPSVSIGNRATLAGIEERAGQALAEGRWRMNFWIEGVDPWAEFDWIGRRLRLGEAEIAVRQRITRCRATTANPETGRRDADTLGVLDTFGHRDMGIYGEVMRNGRVRVGDRIEVLQ